MSGNNTYANVARDELPFPENPNFPDGLRVLIVDDDLVSLEIISTMLESFKYHVTRMTNGAEALTLLRANANNYDIAMIDVNLPDIDGFKLLRIIGIEEMDIPIIIMSWEDSTTTVLKGILDGAQDFMLKPLRRLELQNIWQHVLRKNLLNQRKSSLMTDEIVIENLSAKNRQGGKEKEDVNAFSYNSSSVKKQRFYWSPELHRKFVAVVELLHVDKAVPKLILEIMNEPGLTRENIASHLQKFRICLKNEQAKTTTCQKGIYEANNGGSSGNGMNQWEWDDYNSPQISNYVGQSGHSGFPPSNLPQNEHASHPCPLGVFGVGDYQMQDSTHMSNSFQHNVLPGQNDGRVISTAFSGGVGSDCGRYPIDFQAMDNRPGVNGQGPYMRLLTDPMDDDFMNYDFFSEEEQSGPSSASKT